MKKSLQQIEDHYINQGLSGDKFRQALENDKEYQKILNTKKSKIKNKYNISDEDVKKYVLATEQDYEILSKCNNLLAKNILENDKQVIYLIKSQLLDEWRKPIFNELEKLENKYK